MQIKSIVVGAVCGLIAGVGSVSADELPVADTAGATGAPFAWLDGIATEQMSVLEMAAVRGAGGFAIDRTVGALTVFNDPADAATARPPPPPIGIGRSFFPGGPNLSRGIP